MLNRLCGYQPFQGGKDQKDQKELNSQITNAKYEFHERYWQNISQDGKRKDVNIEAFG